VFWGFFSIHSYTLSFFHSLVSLLLIRVLLVEIMEMNGWRRRAIVDGCNKLLNHSRREWMPVCMILMVVWKELSTTENPWSF
jgi:hypothetical protein